MNIPAVNDVKLVCYTDADYANDSDDRKKSERVCDVRGRRRGLVWVKKASD